MNKAKQVSTLAAMIGALFAGSAVQAAGPAWTPQFYLGVHAGSADGDGKSWDCCSTFDVPGDTRRNNFGLLGGVNLSNGPWSIGVEADYGHMGGQDTGESPPSQTLSETPYNYHVRARLGYMITDKINLYIAGGYAGLRAKMYFDDGGLRFVSKTLNGYSVGAGADVSVIDHGILRLELLHDKYDSRRFSNDYGVDDWKDLTVRAAAIFTF